MNAPHGKRIAVRRPSGLCRLGHYALAAAVFASLCTSRALAASGTWINPTSGGLWSDASNWAGGTIATGKDGTADFSTLDITTDDAIHLNSSRTIGFLIFGDASPSNNWTLDNNGVASNVLTLLTSSGGPLIQVNNGTAMISATLGGVPFTKVGSGTLNVTGVSTFGVGSIATVLSGRLELGNANALQNSTIALSVDNALAFGPSIGTFNIAGLSGGGSFALTDVNGAPITLATGGNFATYSGVMSGAGSLTKTGDRNLTLTGANTFTGGTVVTAGPSSIGQLILAHRTH